MLDRKFFVTLMGATCLAGVIPAAGASAQTAPAAPAADSATPAPAGGLADIIVTARRKDENLQRVPVAATVLSGAALDRQQVRRATDLQYTSPSLVITPDPLGGSSTPIFQLRGQTSPLGSDNTVVTYFADVPVDSRVIAAGIYDLDSVQVVRGPQGTLFGKNSTGGAVLFTPRKANTDKIEGYVSGTYGSYDLRQLTAAVNVPVVRDVLGIRVSGQLARQDGMVKNQLGPDGNDKHYDAVRLSATFTPSDAIRNDLLVTYFNGKQHLNPPITQSIGGFALFFPNVVAAFAKQQALGNRTIANSSPDFDNNKSYLVSNATTVKLGDGISVKNIFGYSNVHNAFDLDATSLNFPLVKVGQDRHQHQVSDELQLFGKNGGLNWIVGGFYSNQKTTVDQHSVIFGGALPLATSHDDYTSKAVFGQATYDFSRNGLNGVKLTGGLRHTWDNRTGSNNAVVTPVVLIDRRLSYTVGLDYQATRNVLFYVAHRRSYKAGGFNLISTGFPAALTTYQPETLADVELGAKTQFTVGSIPIRANLALYQGNYKNIQTQVTGACGSSGLSTIIINAGKGTPKGLEFEYEVRPFTGMDVSGYYNRTLGKYDQFTVPTVNGCNLNVNATALSGQNFGNISKDTFGLDATYTLPLPKEIGQVQVNGNLYNRSARLGNDLTGFNSPLPGYTIYNFRIDYNNIAQSNLSVGFYVKNATNKQYAVTRNNVINLAGYDTQIFGDPRTFGVDAKFKF